MSDSDAVLFANEAFYRAFADRDSRAMRDLWAHDAPCVCVHPGWPPLMGSEEICASWDRILGNDPPDITCAAPDVMLHGDTALVVCWEGVGDEAWLVAVNGFVRRGAVWKMIHHQAGATAGRPPEQQSPPATRPN